MKRIFVFLLAVFLCFALCACDVSSILGKVTGSLGGNDHSGQSNVIGFMPGDDSDIADEEVDDEPVWIPADRDEPVHITVDEAGQFFANGVECEIEVIDGQVYLNGAAIDLEGYDIDLDMLEQMLGREETEPDGIHMPNGAIFHEADFQTTEGGIRYRGGDSGYWVIFPDNTIGDVSFLTEDHGGTDLHNAYIIEVFVYLPDAGMTVLRQEQYRASDMQQIFCKVYQHEQIDGVWCYVSSETTEYSEYYDGYVTSKHEYDPALGMYYPTKLYTFNTEGKPDGHYEMTYYADGTTAQAQGYFADGTPSYIMRYNESGIMIEHIMYREDGSLEGETTYDDNGEPVFGTYYRENGEYWTVENLENATRYTFYDARGNVTSTYDTPNDTDEE